MRTVILVIFLIVCFCNSQSQVTRYFEFSTSCGHSNWQDTTFIAAASNQTLIDSVLANIARPISERKFINGLIAYGNGGYNHNATHWFSWHFIPDQWNLVEFAMEVCDGCPYTDVDADTTTWVETYGQFCPWTGKPVRELLNPVGTVEQSFKQGIYFYPNPALYKLTIKWNNPKEIRVAILSSLGQELLSNVLTKQNETIDISNFKNGIYVLKITDESSIKIGKIVIK